MIAIYHSRDLDGIASGRIIKEKYPEATLVGYHYGEPFDIFPDKFVINGKEYPVELGSPVIMADVSLPMEKMEILFRNYFFRWMDHHTSAINDFYDHFDNLAQEPIERRKLELGEAIGITQSLAYLIDGTAGCVITYGALFGGAVPHGIDLLGDYDVWYNKDPEYWSNSVLLFQYGMRGYNVENFPWDSVFILDEIEKIKEKGKIILEYQREQDKRGARKAFEVDFDGLRAIALNTPRTSSDTLASVYDPDKHDLMILFSYDGSWSYSLRTIKDIDCSALAKKYGGGGHKKAAGFKLKFNLFDNPIDRVFDNMKI